MMNIVELSKRCIRIAEELGLTHEKIAADTLTPLSTVDKFLNKKKPPTDMRYSTIQPIVAYLEDRNPSPEQETIRELENPHTDLMALYARIFDEKNAEIEDLRLRLKTVYRANEDLHKELQKDDEATIRWRKLAIGLICSTVVIFGMLLSVFMYDLLNRGVGWIL